MKKFKKNGLYEYKKDGKLLELVYLYMHYITQVSFHLAGRCHSSCVP